MISCVFIHFRHTKHTTATQIDNRPYWTRPPSPKPSSNRDFVRTFANQNPCSCASLGPFEFKHFEIFKLFRASCYKSYNVMPLLRSSIHSWVLSGWTLQVIAHFYGSSRTAFISSCSSRTHSFHVFISPCSSRTHSFHVFISPCSSHTHVHLTKSSHGSSPDTAWHQKKNVHLLVFKNRSFCGSLHLLNSSHCSSPEHSWHRFISWIHLTVHLLNTRGTGSSHGFISRFISWTPVAPKKNRSSPGFQKTFISYARSSHEVVARFISWHGVAPLFVVHLLNSSNGSSHEHTFISPFLLFISWIRVVHLMNSSFISWMRVVHLTTFVVHLMNASGSSHEFKSFIS